MKVFTFFYNRFDSATTSNALTENGINHTVLVHSKEDADKFVAGGTAKADNIAITENPKGLAWQRNTALAMMEKNEWAVFTCDDFKEVRMLPPEFILSQRNNLPVNFENQQAFRLKSRDVVPLKTMFSVFPKLIQVAEANNIHLIGFGLHDNPQNLKKKFTTRGLADGRFWLVKKSNYQFDVRAQLIDDVCWTAENLVRHGNVLICNWIVPFFKRYTAGGFGTQEERIDLRRKECAYLAMKYHPLIKIAEKPGWPYGTHVRIYGGDKNIEFAKKRLGIL